MKTKTFFVMGVALAAQGLFAALPTVSNLVVQPRWPFSTAVDIDFLLSTGDECDIDVSATWDGQATARLLCTSLSQSRPGLHHLEWNPADIGLDKQELKNFSVTVTPVSPEERLYLTVDFTKTNYFFSATAPENSFDERRYRMSFRRVRAHRADGSTIIYTNGYDAATCKIELPYTDGAPYTLEKRSRTTLREVWFSSDYFIALYPLTSGQATGLGLKGSGSVGINMFTRNYWAVRGSTNATDGVNWPKTGFTVTADSDVGRARAYLRKFLPGTFLDLPTKAQWDTAARSGENGDHIFSLPQSLKDQGFAPISATNCDPTMMTNLLDKIAIWKHNYEAQGKNNNVGRCCPNAWGLYDTAGLCWEMTISDASWGYTGDNAGLDAIASSRTIEASAASKGSYSLLGGDIQTACQILQAVPGEGFGGSYSDTYAILRFVINTTDWISGRY